MVNAWSKVSYAVCCGVSQVKEVSFRVNSKRGRAIAE